MIKPEPITNDTILSVSDASQLIRGVMETAFARIKIRGELSQITCATSGHTYMTVKDSGASISGIIWRGTPIPFKLSDGLEVVITGKITTYPARSNYQIIVSSIEMAGVGAILKMLEERKQKLSAIGYFDQSRKKPIPKYPATIGVVTSPTGAAIHDILNRLRERFPTRVLIWPAVVQGETASREVVAGINGFNKLIGKNRPDVIIVARGGGSIEDLLPFSDESVVIATAESKIPIISGVGHDPDWTLIDFASDMRAPTPTGAAEMVVPDRMSIIEIVNTLHHRITTAVTTIWKTSLQKLNGIVLKSPKQLIMERAQRIDDITKQLSQLMTIKIQSSAARVPDIKNLTFRITQKISTFAQRIEHFGKLLDSYSYHKTLMRGFAIVRDNTGKIITTATQYRDNTPDSITFADGEVKIS